MTGLNLGGGGGDYLPILKYNAKAGRWYIREGEDDKEVGDLQAIFDLDHIQTGWLNFGPNGPDWRPDPDLTTESDRPSADHKRGFKIHVFSKKIDGAREFMSSSQMAAGAIKKLYAEFEESGKGGNGEVPVVKCTGTNAITGKHGTNFEPQLEITKWVARPGEDELPILNGVHSQSAPAPAQAASTDEDEDEFV